MKKISFGKVIYLFCLLGITMSLAHLNYNFYYEPDTVDGVDMDIISQLNFLEDELKNDNLSTRMQNIFPEGSIFINVLYGLSQCDIAEKPEGSSPMYKRALEEAKYAYAQISPEFGRMKFPENIRPSYGVFYRGWKNYLLGKIISIQENPDIEERNEFVNICEEIAEAFASSETPFLESYEKQAWPVDNVVAIANLALYDEIFGDKYYGLIKKWIEKVRIRLDKETGMIPHSCDYQTGYGIEGPRGGSMALALRFLSDIDPEFALEQFNIFKEQFKLSRLGLPGIREYPLNKSGDGDIDSGPVYLDIGLVATVVSIGTFEKYGEHKMAEALSKNVESWGIDLAFGGQKFFLFGLMPMGDAFIAWSRLAKAASGVMKLKGPDMIEPGAWRFAFQMISIFIMLIVTMPLYWKWLKSKKK